MKITKNKNPKHRFNGTVPNNEEGRQFIKNMRQLGLKVEVYGRHSNRKELVGKLFWTDRNGVNHPRTLKDIGQNGRIPIAHAEYLSVTVKN